MLEGVVDVLTTNWDDCLERAGGAERVPSVITEHDLIDVAPKSVLKIHGCATQPSSLLVTTAHLENPPGWVSDQTRARLGTSVVAFVGSGDVAGYVRNRLEEAIKEAGSVENIRVISPGIANGWTDSQWSQLVPDLAVEHRIAEPADAFLEKLGVAYVDSVLADLSASLQDDPVLAEAFNEAAHALCRHDVLRVLSWARHGGVVRRGGVSVLNTESMAAALTALGKLSGDQIEIELNLTCTTPQGPLEVLVSVGAQSARRLRREAQNRLEEHIGNGAPQPTFLIAGGIGWSSTGVPPLPDDILSDGDPKDVLDGPLNVTPSILLADAVLVG
jgi:hypothetical protein